MKRSIVFLCLAIVLLVTNPALSATYYIDFATGSDANAGTKVSPWKRAPGMVGFTGSYSHANGNIFIFKGGVTWTSSFPLSIYSGSAGNITTYTTDHTWYSGGAWSRPIFNGQGLSPSGGMIGGDGKSYFKIHDLEVINYQTCGNGLSQAVQLINCQQLTIDNCKFSTYDWFTIYLSFQSSGTYTNINITNNDVSTTSALCWIAANASPVTVNIVNITGNLFHDGTCGMANDTHLDGLTHIFGVPTFNPDQRFTNVVIAYNKVYGDFGKYGGSGGWTAFMYNEGSTSAKIYNNIIIPDPESIFMGEGMIVFSAVNSETVEVYNNTIVNTGVANVVTGGIVGGAYGAGSTYISKGNIVSGLTNSQYLYNNGTNISDYNCYTGAIQGYTGGDSHTIKTNPLLVNPLTDVSLQSGSPCRDAFPTAQAPTSVFTTDFLGASRPYGSAWDMGAYEYGSGGGDTTAPTVTTKTIASNGTTLTLAFNETVSVGAGGSGGWTIFASGGAATLAYSSGSGTSSLVYTISRAIQFNETSITVSYTQPGNGVEDTAGNDLVTFSGSSVTNSSTQGIDTTPTQFTFTDISNATRSTVYTSNTITVAGINSSATVSITNGTYSKNGGSYTSSAGTAALGDTFSVRHTSSASFSTAVNTILTIGGVSDTYTTTTHEGTPAVIDNLSPSGILNCTSNPMSVTLSFTTNEAATGRISLTDTTYALMTDDVTTTGGTSHSETKTGQACGTAYTWYVRTRDAWGNDNTSSSIISYSIANPQIAGPGGLRIIGGRLSN